jgi:hypothetical protein
MHRAKNKTRSWFDWQSSCSQLVTSDEEDTFNSTLSKFKLGKSFDGPQKSIGGEQPTTLLNHCTNLRMRLHIPVTRLLCKYL